MILDNQTNIVYLAQGLCEYHPLAEELIQALNSEGINFAWLPRTDSCEHIWARDYMPIQLEKDLFLQYRYNPDYLKSYPQYIPDYKVICADIGLNCITTDIVLDGGERHQVRLEGNHDRQDIQRESALRKEGTCGHVGGPVLCRTGNHPLGPV